MLRGDEMMVSLEEKYENFKKTIQECGSYLLTESDDTIKHNLFEEFSIDAISFLHEDTLNLLLIKTSINCFVPYVCNRSIYSGSCRQ